MLLGAGFDGNTDMNVRRGLLRFWVVLTAFWALVCVSIAAVNWRWFEPNSVYEITDRNGTKYTVEAPATASLTEVTDYATKTAQRADCKDDHPGPSCEHPVFLKMPRRDDLNKLILITTIPPLILLAFAGAIRWAFAGFKNDPA